ncbi:MAG: hypothetical protein V8Q32_06010 [Anaerotignum faecicola]
MIAETIVSTNPVDIGFSMVNQSHFFYQCLRRQVFSQMFGRKNMDKDVKNALGQNLPYC